MVFKKGESGNPGGKRKQEPLTPIEKIDLEPWRKKVGKPVKSKELRQLIEILLFKSIVDALDGKDVRPVTPLLRVFPLEPMDDEEVMEKFVEFRSKLLAATKNALLEAGIDANAIKEIMGRIRKRTQGK